MLHVFTDYIKHLQVEREEGVWEGCKRIIIFCYSNIKYILQGGSGGSWGLGIGAGWVWGMGWYRGANIRPGRGGCLWDWQRWWRSPTLRPGRHDPWPDNCHLVQSVEATLPEPSHHHPPPPSGSGLVGPLKAHCWQISCNITEICLQKSEETHIHRLKYTVMSIYS